MPRRVNKIFHDEDTRKRIQAAALCDRLTALIKGEIEMPPHAVTAALGLLRKVLPDLAQVEHSGEIATSKVVHIPAPSQTTGQWENTHIPQAFRH